MGENLRDYWFGLSRRQRTLFAAFGVCVVVEAIRCSTSFKPGHVVLLGDIAFVGALLVFAVAMRLVFIGLKLALIPRRPSVGRAIVSSHPAESPG